MTTALVASPKERPALLAQAHTCLMLCAMNHTMKILELTWTPVTSTDVRTIP